LIVGCDGFAFRGGIGDGRGLFVPVGGRGEGLLLPPSGPATRGSAPPGVPTVKPFARLGIGDFAPVGGLVVQAFEDDVDGGLGRDTFLSMILGSSTVPISGGSGEGEPTETTSKGTDMSSCSTGSVSLAGCEG